MTWLFAFEISLVVSCCIATGSRNVIGDGGGGWDDVDVGDAVG